VSHRKEQKEAAREARLAAERDEAAKAKRGRLLRLGGALAVLAIAAVLVAVLAGGGDDGGGGGDGGDLAGVGDSRAMLQGIPQDGTRLGDPDAPVVITEFADLQCPFCRQYAEQVLPQVIEQYVRSGQVALDLRLLRFIGPDSDRGARAAVVAGREDKMWHFVDLWYRNQGPEGSGYADDDFIRSLASASNVPPDKAIDGISDESTEAPLAKAEQEASDAGISSTPSFLIARKGEDPKPLEVSDLTFDAFQQALAPYLEQ
jgi:protein-disulfide isomerase